MNNNLEKVSLNLLYHKKKKVYILRGYNCLEIYNDKNQLIKTYDKLESKSLIRKLKIESLLDE